MSIYRRKPFRKNLFLIGFLFGFGFYLSGIFWIAYSLTFDDNFKYLIPFAVILIPLFLGIFSGLTILIIGQFLNYNFSSENNQDILSINYEIEEVFVSRSCGFKAIFNNVTVTSDVSNDWILGLTETLENTITIPTIDNESSAHLQIFH